MRLLIVKTSSMGDVVHALPVVADLLRHHPGAQVDWLVESPFAAIPALHPGVRRVLPLAWRKWRKGLLRRDTWQAMAALRRALREQPYDLVLDLQGLLKSVLWGLQARGPLVGYDRSGLREPLAAAFYARTAPVPWGGQAVDRCRRLAAAQLGYAPPDTPPDFGIRAPEPAWPAPQRYGVLITGASRAEKLWPEEHWIAVGRHMQALGWTPVLTWGSPSEGERARRIAQGCDGVVPPLLSVRDTAPVLAGAQQVVGLDTGFSHLAAAFGRDVIGIYCDHEPGEAGLTGTGRVHSLGGKGQRPALQDVLDLLPRA